MTLKFTPKKILEFGTPNRKGVPIFVVFARNEVGVIKSIHETITEAQAAVGFGDTILQYNSTKKIELSFVTTELN